MQKLEIPLNAIVLICGPSCVGKTSFASRIVDEAPTVCKNYLSADQVLAEVAKECIVSQSTQQFLERTQTGFELSANANEVGVKIFSEWLTELVVENDLAVYEACCSDVPTIRDYLRAFSVATDEKKLVLIKLLPSAGLHQKFLRERSPKDRVLPKTICRQRNAFDEVVRTKFMTNMNQAIEYLVSDPREIELSFT